MEWNADCAWPAGLLNAIMMCATMMMTTCTSGPTGILYCDVCAVLLWLPVGAELTTPLSPLRHGPLAFLENASSIPDGPSGPSRQHAP